MSEGPAQARRLVGRDDDLADLTATFRSVQAGRMAAVVLCGEAGAGKTSLVQELAARAAADGAIVLRGGGLDIAESPPFWPVASALRSLLGSADPRAAEVLAPWTEQLDDLLALGGRPASPAAGPGSMSVAGTTCSNVTVSDAGGPPIGCGAWAVTLTLSTHEAGGITSRDWRSYPILTIDDVPEVKVVILPNPAVGAYGGGSEAANALAVSALAAAVFDATGRIARRLPLKPAYLQTILKA